MEVHKLSQHAGGLRGRERKAGQHQGRDQDSQAVDVPGVEGWGYGHVQTVQEAT
jgi:hypothetical protein